MKTINFLAGVVMLCVSSIVISQDTQMDNREELRFGLKAGANFSNIYDSETDDFQADGKLGFAGGIALSIPIGKYFGLQPEVLLSQKGFKGEGSILGSDYSFTRTTTYLDIPLQFQLKPSEFITIIAGPQYSYLLKQKDEFNSSFINSSEEEEFENENIRRNIFGLVAGVDLNIESFVIGGRVGLDIQNNHGDGSSSTPRYKNVWLQGTIGYYF